MPATSVPYSQAGYSGASGAVATTAALALTYTGLCLTNPINSRVSLVLQSVSYAPLVAQTGAIALGLMAGFNATTAVTQTTPAVVVSNYIGNAAGYGLLASAATLPTAPKLLFYIASLITGAITVQDQAGGFIDLNDGQPLLVVPPGGYLCFYTSAASAAASLGLSMQWAEV